MNIRNILKLVSWLGNAQPVQPIITFSSELPSFIGVIFSGAAGFDVYEWEWADNEFFSNSNTGTGSTLVVNNFGSGTIYVRVYARNTSTNDTTPTTTTSRLITAQQLPKPQITADAGVGEVIISITNATNNPANVENVLLYRRANNTGSFTVVHTYNLSALTTPYTNTDVINGTFYQYYVEYVSNTLDFTNNQSDVDDATPESGTPKLSTPTNLQMAWDNVTQGTGVFSANTVTNATSYNIYINNVFVINVATPTHTFTELVVNESNIFGIEAIAVGYETSNRASITRSAPDLNMDFITPEQYGAEAYYKPLDGRRELWNYKSPESFLKGIMIPSTDIYVPYVSMEADIAAATIAYNEYTDAEIAAERYTDYPLITYTPFTQMSVDDKALLTTAGLSGNKYTMITTAINTFTVSDLNKQFCGRENHRNGALGEFIDEYVPYGISARYSKVCLYTSPTKIFVDFEYNNDNIANPQIQENGKGYIFHDNSIALNETFAQAATLSADKNIQFAPLTYNDKVITAYIAPTLNSVNTNLSYNWLLNSSGTRSRIKFGVEDYFYLQLNEEGAIKKYPSSNTQLLVTHYDKVLFRIVTPANDKQFVTHNIQFVPAHGILTAALPVKNKMIDGTNLNLVAFIRPQNGVEEDALLLGAGITNEKFAIAMGDVAGGTYTGSGTDLMHDVSKLSFHFNHDFRYAGAWALGSMSGGSKGGNYIVADAGTFDFGDQSKWAPGSNTFQMRFTPNHDTLGGHIQANEHLPTHSLEAETTGSFLTSHTAGGNYRHLCYHVDKAILFADFVGNARYKGYWQLFYRKFNQAITNNNAATITTNTLRAFLCANIPVQKEIDEQTPKHYVISRGHMLKESNGQHNSLSTPRPISVLNTAENYIDVTYIASGAASSVPRLRTGLKILFRGSNAPTTSYTVNNVVKMANPIYRFYLDEDISTILIDDVTHIIEIPTVPTLGMPYADAISTHINWCVALKKYAMDVNEDDLNYINEDDNKQPIEFQILDTFTNAAWVKVEDSSLFAKGDFVNDDNGNEGVILRVDNYLASHKIVIGEKRTWNGSVWVRDSNYNAFNGSTLTNGTVTSNILSASTFDPQVTHEVVKKQVPGFSGSDYTVGTWETWIDVEDTSIFSLVNGAFTAIDVMINETFLAKVSFKSAQANRIRLELLDDRHRIPAGATISRLDNSATTTAFLTSELLDTSGNYYVHNGASGSQSVGIVLSALRSENIFNSVNISGFYYSDVKVSPPLPDDVNEDLDNQIIFDIQMLHSECEYLLDGNFYDGCHTYLELAKYGNSGLTIFKNNGGTQANGSRLVRDVGYGTSGSDNNQTGFLTPNTWPRDSAGSLGHGRYSNTENSFDYRFVNFKNSYLRGNGSTVTQLYDLGDGGETVYSLMYYMKALNLIGCVNYDIGESFGGGSSSKSPQRHWERMRRIYAKYLADNGVEYVPLYANEGLEVRPRLHRHRSNIATTVILNEEQNVEKSDSVTNAPLYPQTLINLQTFLGDNFLF